mmetsp:Transcript_17200/g.25799  ORF Transcript_17200/g.25799 Transcript_17200/m.25799 type:complete len:1060 (+) Transcript_17200:917-4096(+)
MTARERDWCQINVVVVVVFGVYVALNENPRNIGISKKNQRRMQEQKRVGHKPRMSRQDYNRHLMSFQRRAIYEQREADGVQRKKKKSKRNKPEDQISKEFRESGGFENLAQQRQKELDDIEDRLQKEREEWEAEKNKDMLISKVETFRKIEERQPGAGVRRLRQELRTMGDETVKRYLGEDSKSMENETYYYEDATGILRGPFTVENLQKWRFHLPMDLPLTTSRNATKGMKMFANVVGDGLLYDHWRLKNPQFENAGYCNAPPPGQYWTQVTDISSESRLADETTFSSSTDTEEEVKRLVREHFGIGFSNLTSGNITKEKGGGDYVRCIDPEGVDFYRDPKLSEIVPRDDVGFVSYDDIMLVAERKNISKDEEWLKTPNGFWVPMRLNSTNKFNATNPGLRVLRRDAIVPIQNQGFGSDQEEDSEGRNNETEFSLLVHEMRAIVENPQVVQFNLKRYHRPGYMYNPSLVGGIRLSNLSIINEINFNGDASDSLCGPFTPAQLYRIRHMASMDMPIYFYNGSFTDMRHVLNYADVVGDGKLLRKYAIEVLQIDRRRHLQPGQNACPTALEYWRTLQEEDTKKSLFASNVNEEEGSLDRELHVSTDDEKEHQSIRRHTEVPMIPKLKKGVEAILTNLDAWEQFEGSTVVIDNPYLDRHGKIGVNLTADGNTHEIRVRPDNIRAIPEYAKMAQIEKERQQYLDLAEKARTTIFNILPALKQDPDNENLKTIEADARDNVVFFQTKADMLGPSSKYKRLEGPSDKNETSIAEKMEYAESCKGELAEGWNMHIDAHVRLVYYTNDLTGKYLRQRPLALRNTRELSKEAIEREAKHRMLRIAAEAKHEKILKRRNLGKIGDSSGDSEENPFRDGSWKESIDAWKPLTWENMKSGILVRFDPRKKDLDRENYFKDISGKILSTWFYGQDAIPEGQSNIQPNAEVLVKWQGGAQRVHPLDVLITPISMLEDGTVENKETRKKALENKKRDYVAKVYKMMQETGIKNPNRILFALEENRGNYDASMKQLMGFGQSESISCDEVVSDRLDKLKKNYERSDVDPTIRFF